MIAKGIMYHFNILNDDQHFGYFYDNKENTWKDLDRKQIKYNTTNKYTVDFPIVTVPYFDWNSFVHTWFQVLLINALLFLNVHKNSVWLPYVTHFKCTCFNWGGPTSENKKRGENLLLMNPQNVKNLLFWLSLAGLRYCICLEALSQSNNSAIRFQWT